MNNDFRPDPAPYSRMLLFTGACLLLLVAAMLLSSCSPKIVEKIQVEYRDTTIIKETVRDSLVQVPIPLEKNQAIVNIDDASHLETSVAVSNAYVTKDGQLHHDLANRHDQTLPAIVPIYFHIANTVKTTETAQIVEKTVEVPKPLSWWQSLKIAAFPWLLGLLAAAGLWMFRKPILKLIRQ